MEKGQQNEEPLKKEKGPSSMSVYNFSTASKPQQTPTHTQTSDILCEEYLLGKMKVIASHLGAM